MAGSITSSTTTSGRNSRMSLSAFCPSAARRTSHPSYRSGIPSRSGSHHLLRGEEEDRRLIPVRAQPRGQGEAVDGGQHHVEHDHVGPEFADELERLLPVRREAHVPPLV